MATNLHAAARSIRAMAVGLVAGLGSGAAGAALISVGNTVGGAADASYIERSVNIGDSGLIADLDIAIDWSKCGNNYNAHFLCAGKNHNPFAGEAYMTLTGPSGITVSLFPSNFFTGPGDGIDVSNTFDDEAAFALPTTIQSGTFRPVGSLAAFDGTDVFGLWTLRIGDTVGLDPILFRSFTLNVTTAAVEPVEQVVSEPGSLALLGLGMIGLGSLRRRSR